MLSEAKMISAVWGVLKFQLLELSKKGMGKCFRNDGSVSDPALGSAAIRSVQ